MNVIAGARQSAGTVPRRSCVSDGRWLGRLAAVALAVGLVSHGSPARAQSAENVAVVINENSPDSVHIGEYYARGRSLPDANVFRIRTSVDESIDRATYVSTIEQPLAAAIGRSRSHDRILYLVLTKGVPLRVRGTAGINGNGASVDSELTLLYRRLTGEPFSWNGSVANPYFLGDAEIRQARRFTHREHDIYLVSRLDGFTAADVTTLIDRSAAPRAEGRIVLDQRAMLVNRTVEDWMDLAAKRLAAEGHAEKVVLETTPAPVRDVAPVLAYASWGSMDPQNRVRRVGLGFVPGSIAVHFVGSGARTFRAPPETWTPTANAPDRYAGTAESLIGDLISEGVTGAGGSVSEAYLLGSIRPQVLFPAYLAGFNLIEAFYLATPRLSWQTVIVGDPLAAPFPRPRLTPEEIEGEPDEITELPEFFNRRMLGVLVAESPGATERALAFSVRASALESRGDRNGARQALEEALRLSPRLVPALLRLAGLEQKAGLHAAAIERYKQVLETQPNSPFALNNLAYALAVHGEMPAEALPLARRAAALAPKEPAILDTLAWIQHLLGDHEAAAKLMAEVARAAPNDPEIRLHGAIIFAAVGARGAAGAELREALRLDPALETRADVQELKAELAAAEP